MGGKPSAAGRAPSQLRGQLRRRLHGLCLASPVTAAVIGGLVLALEIVEPPLAMLAHQNMNNTSGSVPPWFSAAFALVGFVVAWRRPGNPLDWLMLAMGAFFALSEDASFYVVAAYRLRPGGLPLGWAALLAQPTWAPAIVLVGLLVFLFPDGRLPSPRWRWALWLYLGVAALWAVGTIIVTVGAIATHRTSVDSGGNLLLFDHPAGFSAWWGAVNDLHSAVAVAAATLAAAGLFAPARRRVQHVVDRRFNRARYDADQTLAAFAARLKDAVDLDAVRDDLAGVVQAALEPTHVSMWIRPG
jgi:hypothetical protein